MYVWKTEEVIDLLESGPVRLKLKFTGGELMQYTRDMGTADTCNCHKGEKSCGFISELEWTHRLHSLDTDERISVWDIGNHVFRTLVVEEIDKIIGHSEDETPSCCSTKEK